MEPLDLHSPVVQKLFQELPSVYLPDPHPNYTFRGLRGRYSGHKIPDPELYRNSETGELDFDSYRRKTGYVTFADIKVSSAERARKSRTLLKQRWSSSSQHNKSPVAKIHTLPPLVLSSDTEDEVSSDVVETISTVPNKQSQDVVPSSSTKVSSSPVIFDDVEKRNSGGKPDPQPLDTTAAPSTRGKKPVVKKKPSVKAGDKRTSGTTKNVTKKLPAKKKSKPAVDSSNLRRSSRIRKAPKPIYVP
ncbi:hypothetical protein GEMRC1_001662 [Eukaryota sp. GEM-RC1]